jgi:ethanolamine utilization cobalamin adenosyltransferase
MLTFMQLKLSKAKRKLTQEQRAQIVDIEAARKFVRQAIDETLAVNRHTGLSEEDLDRIFNNQPVHYDDLGYVPHWFERQDIWRWGCQIYSQRYRSEYEQKK